MIYPRVLSRSTSKLIDFCCLLLCRLRSTIPDILCHNYYEIYLSKYQCSRVLKIFLGIGSSLIDPILLPFLITIFFLFSDRLSAKGTSL